MAVTDLVRSLPGLAIFALLPGLALSSLLAPSWAWWQRLALAPGLSAGVVGVAGLMLHDLHLGFDVETVLPVVPGLSVVAAVRGWRRRGADAEAPAPGRPERLLLVGTALLGGLLTSAMVASAFQGSVLPNEVDAPIHGAIAAGIARQHDILAPQPMPIAQSDLVRPRAAFEATAALVSELGGPSPVSSMLPVTLLAVLLLPLGLAVLMYEASGSWRLAALTSLLGVGMSFPGKPVTFGQYPYVLDATLVVPLMVASRRALLGVHRVQNLALVGAMVASVWVVHGLEILTAATVGIPFAVAALHGRAPRRIFLDLAALVAVVGAGALAVTLLTRAPVPPPAHNPPGISAATMAPLFIGQLGSPGQSLQAISDFAANELAAPIALACYLLGVAAVLMTRRLRWALVAHAAMLAMFVDVGFTDVLHRLWDPVFPWATPDRLVGIQYFAVPLIMAWGIAHAGVVVPPTWRGSLAALSPPRWMPVALGAATALTAAVWGGVIGGERLHARVSSSSLATGADLEAMARMDAVLPPGSLVLTDGEIDAGQWIDAVTTDLEWQPIGYDRDYLYHGAPFDTSPQAQALSLACRDPAAAESALHGISAVFVGAREKQDPSYPWSLSCLERLPGLHPLVRVTQDGRTAVVLGVGPSATG
jgi:Family of unknown function (DUF6541)